MKRRGGQRTPATSSSTRCSSRHIVHVPRDRTTAVLTDRGGTLLTMLNVPAHAQTSSTPDAERRELLRRAADLCRARPAVYAAAVRRADALRAGGMLPDEALRQAVDEALQGRAERRF